MIEKIKSYDLLLPDLESSIKYCKDRLNLENVFCAKPIYDKFRKLGLTATKEGRVVGSKLKEMLYSGGMNKNMEKKYRNIRGEEDTLSRDDYNLLITAASDVLEHGEKVAIVSDNDNLFRAYSELVSRHSYLTKDKLGFCHFSPDFLR